MTKQATHILGIEALDLSSQGVHLKYPGRGLHTSTVTSSHDKAHVPELQPQLSHTATDGGKPVIPSVRSPIDKPPLAGSSVWSAKCEGSALAMAMYLSRISRLLFIAHVTVLHSVKNINNRALRKPAETAMAWDATRLRW
jgi:hypothetical protein